MNISENIKDNQMSLEILIEGNVWKSLVQES